MPSKQETIVSALLSTILLSCLTPVAGSCGHVALMTIARTGLCATNEFEFCPVIVPRSCRLDNYFTLPEKFYSRRVSITGVTEFAQFIQIVQSNYGISFDCAPIFLHTKQNSDSDYNVFSTAMEDDYETLPALLESFIRSCWLMRWPIAITSAPPCFPIAIITPSNVIITTATAVPGFRTQPAEEFDLFKDDFSGNSTHTNGPDNPAELVQPQPKAGAPPDSNAATGAVGSWSAGTVSNGVK